MQEMELIRSKRRSVELRVLADGRLQVRAPQQLPRHAIETFIASRQAWIRQQRLHQAQRPRQYWHHGAQLYFRGQALTLYLAAGSTRVEQEGRVLQVRLQEPDDAAKVQSTVQRWLRRMGRELMEDSIERQFNWFAARGHQRPVLRMKIMRTRWGSLSSRGYINLNLALLHYPPAVLDYVVMHELCHLEHRNHGAGFHRLMDARMPDWRQRKTQLDEPFYCP